MKKIIIIISIIILLIGCISSGFIYLNHKKDNPKPYVIEMNQDLATLYNKWIEGTPQEQAKIKQEVLLYFEYFDSDKVFSPVIREWLVKIRGY